METLIYNAHVGPGRTNLIISGYAQLGGLAILLIALHALCFLIPQGVFREALQRFKIKLERSRQALRENLVYALLALPVLFLA